MVIRIVLIVLTLLVLFIVAGVWTFCAQRAHMPILLMGDPHPLVLGIGLPRTGACSLTAALSQLGFFFGCSGMCKFTPVACGISATNTILFDNINQLTSHGYHPRTRA